MQSANNKFSIVWLKKDLRLLDSEAFTEAAKDDYVITLFSLDSNRWNAEDISTRHKIFTLRALMELSSKLEKMKVPLYLANCDLISTLTFFKNQLNHFKLISHEETGNYASFELDKKIQKWCKENGIVWKEMRQNNVIRGLKDRNLWSKKWNQYMRQSCLPIPIFKNNKISNSIKENCFIQPLSKLSFKEVLKFSNIPYPCFDDASLSIPEKLNEKQNYLISSFFNERIFDYSKNMSSPLTGEFSCSRLSPFLSVGMISLRSLFQEVTKQREKVIKNKADKRLRDFRSFEKRLHWRCHFIQKLESEPSIEHKCLHPKFNNLRNEGSLTNKQEDFLNLWKEGKTGLPFLDACMIYLEKTGWINFRMRAMLISFVSNNLWIHWKHSGLHLAKLFLDYEPGIHWPQVQMQSGTTGINTIRIYNPEKQQDEQDPDFIFTKTWNPNAYSTKKPIVDLKASGNEARKKLWATRKEENFKKIARIVYQNHGSRMKRTVKSAPNKQRPIQLSLID